MPAFEAVVIREVWFIRRDRRLKPPECLLHRPDRANSNRGLDKISDLEIGVGAIYIYPVERLDECVAASQVEIGARQKGIQQAPDIASEVQFSEVLSGRCMSEGYVGVGWNDS